MSMDKQDDGLKNLMVGLYVYGENLNPDLISEAVSTSPTRVQRKGDVKATKSGNPTPAKTGMWELMSSVSSLSLSDHVADLFGGLGKDDVFLLSLDGVDDVHLDVYSPGMCAGEGYKYLDLELSLGDMRRLAKLGASVRISVVEEPA